MCIERNVLEKKENGGKDGKIGGKIRKIDLFVDFLIWNGKKSKMEMEERWAANKISIVDSIDILAFVPRTRYSHSHNRSRCNFFIG